MCKKRDGEPRWWEPLSFPFFPDQQHIGVSPVCSAVLCQVAQGSAFHNHPLKIPHWRDVGSGNLEFSGFAFVYKINFKINFEEKKWLHFIYSSLLSNTTFPLGLSVELSIAKYLKTHVGNRVQYIYT